ncbi:MAG: NADH-quinone oxidoreductase subunit B family protein [Planctomycetota bacterium]
MGILRHSAAYDNVVFADADALLNLSKENSIWYLLFATACCGIELMQTGASRFDLDRFGMIPRPTPRQADLMIVAGTITHKMASRVKRLYEQMPEPKWVISMGSCANAGGPFCKYSYSVVRGIDKYIPVDVYVPGCPPRPEALIEGVFKLREKIRREGVLRREPVQKEEHGV